MATERNSETKIALITGGSRGLGRAMALHLAQRGVDIIFTYRAKAAEASEVQDQIRAIGRKAVSIQFDVTDTGKFEAFARSVAEELERTWGRNQFDYLVNNAGVSMHAGVFETTEAQLDEVFKVNFKGPFLLTKQLLPRIVDGGRILNVSSGLARMTIPGSGVYGAMKAGLETLTRYMAKELGPRKITANIIAPGAIATDFSGGMVRDNPEVAKMITSMTALGRIGQPDDIGGAVAMLLSPGFGWLNGQRIEVSGGQSL